MARSNFGFQKYQKELKRKQKSDKKRQRALDKKNPAPGATSSESPEDPKINPEPVSPAPE